MGSGKTMELSREEVLEIALLARLELSEEEIAGLRRDLGAILGYVAQLEKLDTDGVEPTTHAVPMDCPLRADVVHGSLPRAEAQAAAPAVEDGFYCVPSILDVPGGAR